MFFLDRPAPLPASSQTAGTPSSPAIAESLAVTAQTQNESPSAPSQIPSAVTSSDTARTAQSTFQQVQTQPADLASSSVAKQTEDVPSTLNGPEAPANNDFQPGSILGIANVTLRDGSPGTKTLTHLLQFENCRC